MLDQFFPFGFFKARGDAFWGDEDGAFDEHAVGGQQLVHLLIGHVRQAVFELHFFIEHSAGIEETL